jgi:cytochrome c oxidase subunit I+III
MGTMTAFWAIQGLYSARRHAPVANITRAWTAAVVVWVIGFATLYLGPYLT